MTRSPRIRGSSLNIVAIFGVVMPAIITFGYNQSLAGGVLYLSSFDRQFPQMDVNHAPPSEKSHTSTVRGTVVALYAVGGLFGAIFCIWLGDRLGRRRTIIIASVIQIIGAILMASSFHLAQLIISRIIVGLGTGSVLATVPVWQSEISPASRRGAHVATTGIFIGLGLTIALLIDLGFSFTKGSIGWRLPFALQIPFSALTIGTITFLPESPRWMIQRGNVAEGREILAALDDIDVDSPLIDEEIREVQLNVEKVGKSSFKELFSMGPEANLQRMCISVASLTFLQLTGVNAITFYTTTIFQNNLLLSSVNASILAAAYQFVSPIGGIVCIFTIERFGRRKLMLFSAAGNMICMALLAALSSQPQNKHAIDGAVFFTFLFHFTYVIGFGGIPFLYVAEFAPLHLRATISGISIGAFWIFNFLIAEVSPIAYDAIRWRYFLVWACLNAAMLVVIHIFFPETAGRTLEEIDAIFAQSKNIFDTVKVASRMPHRTPVPP